MKTNKWLVYSSVATFVIAVGFFVYVANASKALSYLSSDAKNCINCHVMNTQYATWQHGSHAERATCIECHLPTDGFVNKYMAKARDGFRHSVAFTFNTFANSIQITENAAERVQANCLSCHTVLSETMIANQNRYLDSENGIKPTNRYCWDCHREVAHGKNRSLITTPYALGVRDKK